MPAGPGEPTSSEALTELRQLLLASEQAELAALQRRLDDPEIHAADVSRVLVEAVTLRTRQDEQLTSALRPTVENALHASVREDPGVLASALFPVMGTAIRKAIAAALSSMIQSIDQVLEHSLSLRGLVWRLEALRTGKPFAEIVLRHSLIYRVEQVFLIHRETGLPLRHRATSGVTPQDSGLVSGMLTAIQDFVRDSFHAPASDALETLQVGELSLWIAQGPRAVLAAVVRGHPPQALRTTLQETLEEVHRRWGLALERFRGDAAPFEPASDLLDACLQAQYVTRSSRNRMRRGLAAAAVVLLALGVWAALAIRDGRRWVRYLDALRAQPGIVVMSAGSRNGSYFVMGLRDPLAADPARILAAARMTPKDVAGHWEPFHALDPAFVLARVRTVLRPPASVVMALQDGVLTATGSAPWAWIRETRQVARVLPGIVGYEDKGLDPIELLAVARRIEAGLILFPPGAAEPTRGQREVIAALAADVGVLDAMAAEMGRRVRLEIVGRTDRDASDGFNRRLSQQRAERMAWSLGVGARSTLSWTARGVSTTQPLGSETSAADKAMNRSVSLRVSFPRGGEESVR